MHHFLVWIARGIANFFHTHFFENQIYPAIMVSLSALFQGPSGMNPFLMRSFLGWTFESGTNSTDDQVDHAHLIESVQNALSVCKTSAKLRLEMHGQETILTKNRKFEGFECGIFAVNHPVFFVFVWGTLFFLRCFGVWLDMKWPRKPPRNWLRCPTSPGVLQVEMLARGAMNNMKPQDYCTDLGDAWNLCISWCCGVKSGEFIVLLNFISVWDVFRNRIFLFFYIW